MVKMIIDAGKVGMGKTCEQVRLSLKGLSRCYQLLLAQTALAHLLDRHQSIPQLSIFCLLNRSHPPLANLTDDAITLLEQGPGSQQPGGGADERSCV